MKDDRQRIIDAANEVMRVGQSPDQTNLRAEVDGSGMVWIVDLDGNVLRKMTREEFDSLGFIIHPPS